MAFLDFPEDLGRRERKACLEIMDSQDKTVTPVNQDRKAFPACPDHQVIII